ncbi:unnamed protein product [Arctogadus glacialis]
MLERQGHMVPRSHGTQVTWYSGHMVLREEVEEDSHRGPGQWEPSVSRSSVLVTWSPRAHMTREGASPACYHISDARVTKGPGEDKGPCSSRRGPIGGPGPTDLQRLAHVSQDHVHQISRFPDLEVVVVVEEEPSPDPNPTLQREGVP